MSLVKLRKVKTMNKRIKKKHYDLKCDNIELDESCWDYLESKNISRCSDSLRKQRKCPHYIPYKKSNKFWRKLNELVSKRYLKEHLK